VHNSIGIGEITGPGLFLLPYEDDIPVRPEVVFLGSLRALLYVNMERVAQANARATRS